MNSYRDELDFRIRRAWHGTHRVPGFGNVTLPYPDQFGNDDGPLYDHLVKLATEEAERLVHQRFGIYTSTYVDPTPRTDGGPG